MKEKNTLSTQEGRESSETHTTLKGILIFHSETGTEGGYWAFQDESFISKKTPDFGIFGGETVFDASNPERKGKTQDKAEVLHGDKWDPLPDPVQEEEDYILSSLFCGEERGDKDADKRLMEKYDFKIKYATERMDEMYGKGKWHLEDSNTAIAPDGSRIFFGGTPHSDRPYGLAFGDVTRNIVEWEDGVVEERFSPTLLKEAWSYEGLHVLEDGDELTIYDKEDTEKVVWQGTIALTPFSVFQDSAYGMWIHNDQIGQERDLWARWFMNENPARLTTKPKINQATQ